MSVQFGLRMAALCTAAWLGLAAAGSVHAQAGTPAARSAQSDCQREAARRGYTVLATRNYQQYKDGWSLDLQARDYAGRVSWGSCFVETRTGDVSLYGFGWGSGGGGGGSGSPYEFNCASVEGKYRECQLPVNGRARLVKQKSAAPCVQSRSWGQRGDRVWVDDGCRAKFEVVVAGGGGGGGVGGGYVECRSEQQKYRECSIARGYVGRLASDDSGGKCRNAGAWGTRDGLIWVNYGCKGRFELLRSGGGSGGSSGGGNTGQQRRAAVQCRTQAARDGVSVRSVTPPQLRGSFWETTVQGTRGGTNVRAICRYYPNSNRAQLFYGN
ncbi:MAG: DUF3011 domain-containing protein [Gammaproteobacteria bacterium]|nr:DUF3011 domain-containing protein [Gammaproteobacteria bacterium]